MASKSIHKVVLSRLVLAWLFLSITIGGSVFYLKTEKIDNIVLELALRESSDWLGKHPLPLGHINEAQLASLRETAAKMIGRHFSVVELYDRNRIPIIQATRPETAQVETAIDQREHRFPLSGELRYEKFYLNKRLYLQVLLPLHAETGELVGYFEGVYQVDDETLHTIETDVYQTLLLVIVVIFSVTVALYPIIIGLNKSLYKLSLSLLLGNVELMAVLGGAIAKRDSDTNEHNYRVTIYAAKLGEAVGVQGDAMRDLIAGSFLHDVGKIGVSDTVLLKPDRLTDNEMDRMREHVILGVDIVHEADWLQGARDVIEFHHEKYDGSGYMQQLKGEDIPLNARIFAIVDVFDALTSKRPYKEPIEFNHAMALLAEGRGTHFDPLLLSTFANLAQPLYEKVHDANEDTLADILNIELKKHFFAQLHHPIKETLTRLNKRMR